MAPIRVQVSVVLIDGQLDDCDRIINYLKLRVPSFEVLIGHDIANLECHAAFIRRRRLHRKPGPCTPCGRMVLWLRGPVRVADIERRLRSRAA